MSERHFGPGPRPAVRARIRASGGRLAGLLRRDRVAPVVFSSLIARMPKGIVPLAVVLLVHDGPGGYLLAGTLAALVAIGDAASTPWQGRLIDTRGRGVVLLPSVALHVAAMITMISAARAGSGWLLVCCAVAAGIGMPPVSGAVKAVWAQLVDADATPTAYLMESLLQQVIFCLGPVLVSVLATLADPGVTVIASAALSGAGTVWFVVAARGTTSEHPPDASRHGALRVPAVRYLSGSTLLQGVTFGVRPVALTAVATLAGAPALVGVLQATFSLGGLAGTFTGTVASRPQRFVGLLWWFALALLPPVLLCLWPSVPVLLVMSVVLVVPGLCLTPLAATSYVLTERSTGAAHRTEAFAWLSTSLAVGTSAGSALAGALTDVGGPALAMAAAPVAVGAAAVLSRRLLPATAPPSSGGR